jgi:dienelactone hydrolase
VEFENASQRLNSIEIIPGDRIQGYLAKPEGAGPFPAVVGLHGCAGMHDMTRQRLTDDLVAWGYVILLVDSYATRGIEHACTSSAFATVIKRTRDAYGALVFLASQTFVNPQRVAAVGFSAGAWVTLSVAEPNSFKLFVPPSNLRFRAAAALYPPCQQATARPGIPTLIFIGALDDWTPAADFSNKVAAWGTTGRQSGLLCIPARTTVSITRTFGPAGPCWGTGWNTTARQRTMLVTACTSFSIATSTEGTPMAATQIVFFCGSKVGGASTCPAVLSLS